MTSTVLVTGASGHVGANLVRALISDGQHVRALVHRDAQALEGLDVERVVGDVTDPTSLQRAFRGVDTVYHTAAVISLLEDEWDRLEAVNIHGTRHVVEACLEVGVRRLVHFSTIDALVQEPLDVPLDEDRQLVGSDGRAPYDRSKAAGERCVRDGLARGLDAVILYPTAVVGPFDFKPSHAGGFLLALARGRLPALVTGGFDWVDVRDVAAGAVRAARLGKPGARYLLSGHWASVSAIADLAAQVTGVPAPRLVCPLGLAELLAPLAMAVVHLFGGRQLYTSVAFGALRGNPVVSHARATRDLGYRPRPLAETITDTYRFFLDVGMLAEVPATVPAGAVGGAA